METEAAVQRPRGLRSIRHRRREAVHADLSAQAIVLGAVGVYASAFVAAAVVHYLDFRSPHTDLGNMAQAVWSTAHGHFLQATAMSGRQVTRLAAHVEPFLALLVPLWWLWGSPMLLVVVQAIAVSVGALPVYWLARKHLASDRAGVHFALAYLLFPATQFNAFTMTSGFHAVALAVPFVLFAIWFLDEERLVLFGVFALLAASTKEEIPAAIGCLGIWYAVSARRRLAGLAIFAVGVAWTFINFLVIIPHFSRSGIDPFAGRYKQVGSTPTGILHKLVSDPAAFVHAVATTHKLSYLLLMLVPFLGLCLLEPLVLCGALPDLAINLLSSKADQTRIAYHWTAGIVPFVVAASIFGAARLHRNPARLSLLVLVAVGCTAIYSPLFFLPSDVRALSSPERTAATQALKLIPNDAPVSASNRLGSALSTRRYSFVFPTLGSATWVAVDGADPTYSDTADYRRAVRAIERSANWKIVYTSHGVTVLRRADPRVG